MESKKVQAVLSALSFFEIFHCPLTRSEIFNYVFDQFSNIIPGRPEGELEISQSSLEFSWSDLNVILADLSAQGIIQNQQSLYYLKSNDAASDAFFKRHQYYATFHKKLKRAQRWARFMSAFPGVRLVATVNSVGFKIPSEGADIDFLIITDEKSLYVSRLLITFFLKILGLRPTKKNQKDKICTSFWLSESALNLEKIAYSDQDVYLYYWLLNIYPLYDQADYYERWQSANFWLKKHLPNSHFSDNINKIKLSTWSKTWKFIGETLFVHEFFNGLAKKFQHRFFSPEIKELMNKDTRVIVSDQMLKFHTVDNRQKYFEIYNQYLKDSLNKHQYVAKEN